MTLRKLRGEIHRGHEIVSDGTRVWINGPDGAAVARFSARAGRDVHKPFAEVVESGEECLDCSPSTDWPEFVESVLRHYGLEVSDRHRPTLPRVSEKESAS